MGDFTIEDKFEKIRKIFEQNGFKFTPLKAATPEEFHSAIGAAKEMNKFGAYVEQHTIEDYEKMRFLFLTLDNKAGVAITTDNNIVSVFNGGEQRGVLKTLLPVALEFGGEKLDNYNSDKLSSLYELYGFDPISNVEFDKTFAPDDWNYERDGMPDIVFWLHNGDSVNDVLFNFGGYDVNWDNVKKFTTYEDAEAYRNSKINHNIQKEQEN